MPRYFFNVYDGYSELDDTGTEFPDVHAAQTGAVRVSGEIIRDMGSKFRHSTEWRLEVTDEDAAVLFVTRFSVQEFPLKPPMSVPQT